MIRTTSQVTNPSFEVPGAEPSDALGWNMVTVATYEELAFYSVSTIESFEDWSGGPFAFVEADVSRAIFDSTTLLASAVERFEAFWLNNHHALFSFTYASMDTALFGAALDDVEMFESGWDNDELLTTMPAVQAAAFDGESKEDFEDAWSNDTYFMALNPFFLLDGHFLPGLVTAENFESEWADELDGL